MRPCVRLGFPNKVSEAQRDAHTRYCVKNPEQVVLRMHVDDGVAAYLQEVEAVPPNLDKAHHLERNEVENKYLQGVVAAEDEETLEPQMAGRGSRRKRSKSAFHAMLDGA